MAEPRSDGASVSKKKTEETPEPEPAEPHVWQTGKIMRRRAHSTGLVDYDYWVYAFANAEPAPEKPFRRGRIWA